MGEIAEMMLDGTLCQLCGVYMGDDRGYPRTCRDCREMNQIAKEAFPPVKVECPICKRRVKKAGLADHTRVVHPSAD